MIWLLVKYILMAARRDKLLIGFLLLIVIGASLSIFLGSSALTEQDQFSVVFMANGLRLGSVLTLLLFCVFYLRRSYDTRDVEYLLTRPLTCFQFLLAHSFAFSILATIAAVFITVSLIALSQGHQIMGHVLWGVSVWVELIIIANTALFFSLILSSAVAAVLTGFAFYMLSRLIGSILGIVSASEAGSVLNLVTEKVMLVISIIIPRLDMMGQSSWLIYGFDSPVSLGFIFVQGVVFCGLVFSAALFDLQRKQF